jgi:hypothetical protein
MFGFWTEQYISALGQGSGGGSGTVTAVKVGTTTYNPTDGVVSLPAYPIGTVTQVKVGTTNYNPSSGVVSLPSYPTDADTLDGYHASASNAPFGTIPVIYSQGFMDVGNSFEMHYDNSGSLDYSTRLYCTGNYGNNVALPSKTGTLALTSQIPTKVSQLTNDSGFITSSADISGNAGSATKLKTARTIWGQSFDGTGNVSGAITGATTISASSSVSVGGQLTVSGGFVAQNQYARVMFGDGGDGVMINTVRDTDSYYALYLSCGESTLGTVVNSTFVVRANGNVGIGVSKPSYKLHVSGDIYATGAVTCLSDIREKNILGQTRITVEQIASMPSIVYKWKDNGDDCDEHVGSIAQNWQNVLPQVVLRANDKEGTLSMQYGVAALVSSIITARKVVDHERRIAELERENKELKMKLKIA